MTTERKYIHDDGTFVTRIVFGRRLTREAFVHDGDYCTWDDCAKPMPQSENPVLLIYHSKNMAFSYCCRDHVDRHMEWFERLSGFKIPPSIYRIFSIGDFLRI